jgi:hypothetical protein
MASEAMVRAFRIVRDERPDSVTFFGELMWPDGGGHIGIGLKQRAWRMAGGYYLAKLVRDGYLRRKYTPLPPYRCNGWALTEKGQAMLLQIEQPSGAS